MEGNRGREGGHHARRRKMSALVPEPWRKRMLGFGMVGWGEVSVLAELQVPSR